MIITNNHNLPQPIVDAVARDPYDGENTGDISVTRLIQPPRKVALEKANELELTQDAADRIWALLGQVGHLILERSANHQIVEKRFFMAIGGWSVSGKCDVMQMQTLLDYKFTSVWTAVDGVKREWVEQLNLLALLARHNGYPIVKAEIVAIFRDWNVMESRRNRKGGYPAAQVATYNIPLWDENRITNFAQDRVSLHQKAQEEGLPECTADERWERASVWAVMKKGRKKAVNGGLWDNPTQAEEHARKLGIGQHSVEVRPGEQVRCANYCAAAPFCDQWKGMKPAGDMPTEDGEEDPS